MTIKEIKKHLNKIVPFDVALKLCQTLNRYTDDCDEKEVFGYALYGNKLDDNGIVVTKDHDIDENEWTIIMCNAKYHMKEDEIGLKVKIHKEE
ncbi:MAG: hypothetical protein HOC66_06615 [Flavobacteriales bacterium]|jgi:hypothetical protein|nr:hypothetical protein [Flavobacteriales bacterium]